MTSSFKKPEDIANRALQHCGARRIVLLTEDSQNASECAAAYDNVRQAEIQRNLWKFATKIAALRPINVTVTFPAATSATSTNSTTAGPTMRLLPETWNSAKVYQPGAIVQLASGDVWRSDVPNNLGNTPGADGGVIWDTYFGPLVVQPWVQPGNANPQTSFFAGELVYKTDNHGHYQVYVSMMSDNSADPAAPLVWSATNTFLRGQVVEGSNGWFYMSMIDFNLANDPTTATLLWNLATTYALGNLVAGIDGFIYESLVGSNTGHDPTTDPGTHWYRTGALQTWTSSFSGGTGSPQWARIDATLGSLVITYPIGAGPSAQRSTRNVYVLPNGYLRKAPQDPKAGGISYLGAPSGRMYDDWEIQDGFLITNGSDTIVLRFIADVTQVARMDPMFCEGLACRLADAVVEPITQSSEKKVRIEAAYKVFMSEARLANSIDTGAVEAPLDDWLAARI